MSNLNKLIQDIHQNLSQVSQKLDAFIKKMATHQDQSKSNIHPDVIKDFARLYAKFESNPDGKIDWEKLQDLSSDDQIDYSKIDSKKYQQIGTSLTSQVVVLKLNGGLGTSMGLSCAKSSMIVDPNTNRSFLDFIKAHIDNLSEEYDKIDLWLLNSFNTCTDTKKVLHPDQSQPCPYKELLQNKFPKINLTKDSSGQPICTPFENPTNPDTEWNPPGHGDIYRTLAINDALTQMLKQGKKYLFISNADNLGATIDPAIIGYMQDQKIDFLMETTPKTLADIKGGTVVRYQDRLFLLERAQVPLEYIPDFEDIQRFAIFNTNNIWINIEALSKALQKPFQLPLIINKKYVEETKVAQLETAMGAAICHFDQAKVLVVPRNRFFPVKNTSDLLLLRSDYIQKNKSTININPKRQIQKIPTVHFSAAWRQYEYFSKHMQTLPSLINCQEFELDGDITFLDNVIIEGNVSIQTNLPIKISNQVVFQNTKIHIFKNKIPAIEPFPSEIHPLPKIIKVSENIFQLEGKSFSTKNNWKTQIEISQTEVSIKSIY